MSIARSVLTQYFPHARDREDGLTADGEVAAQKHQRARPSREFGQNLDEIAGLGGCEKLRLHVQGHTMGMVAHVPRRLTECRIGERHEHPAMDHATHVDMPILDDEGKASRALRALLENRTNVALERIDQLGLRETVWRGDAHR